MKIAIVSGTFPPFRCGVGDYVERYALAMAATGAEVHVITSRGAGRKGGTGGVTLWPEVKDWRWRGMAVVRDRIAALNPDVVHLQYPTLVYGKKLGINLLPVALKRRWPNLPLLTTFHEFAQYSRVGQWRLAPMIWWSDAVAVTSGEERSAVLRRFPGARRKVRVIPVGAAIPIDGSRAAGLRLLHRLGAEPGDRLIGYFGMVGPGKGVPQLVEAVRRLWDSGVRIRLIGMASLKPKVDPIHRAVIEQAKELEIQGRITWTGFLPERQVSDCLLACDAIVMPFDDGLKLNRSSFIAALLHGVPVVTTLGPASRLIAPRAGRRLALCNPDAASIADATVRLLRHPPPRDLRAPRRFPEFTWPGIAAAYDRLYQSMI